MHVFQRVLFKFFKLFKLYCLGLQDWFVDSRTIAARLVSEAFEGRHYYSSIVKHLKGDIITVQ